MSWYVLYTKPRNEKKVALLLEQKGVVVYCPTQETIKQWSDRKKKVVEPVFRSYLFVQLDEYKKDSVYTLTTPGAVRFLWWQGKPGVVRDEEIQQIKDFLGLYKDAIITTQIHEGEEVTIKEGVLKENKGKVLRVQGNKVTLHLKSIGLNIIAQVPLQSIEKQ